MHNGHTPCCNHAEGGTSIHAALYVHTYIHTCMLCMLKAKDKTANTLVHVHYMGMGQTDVEQHARTQAGTHARRQAHTHAGRHTCT